jgi:hypothetical protein
LRFMNRPSLRRYGRKPIIGKVAVSHSLHRLLYPGRQAATVLSKRNSKGHVQKGVCLPIPKLAHCPRIVAVCALDRIGAPVLEGLRARRLAPKDGRYQENSWVQIWMTPERLLFIKSVRPFAAQSRAGSGPAHPLELAWLDNHPYRC